MSGRITVTPKGVDLQLQILKETVSPSPALTSSKFDFGSPQSKSFRSTSSNLAVPVYFFPNRSGYFGPKPPESKTSAFTNTSSSRDHLLYPNYLKRDPKEYPAKHICIWKPKSTIKETERMPEEVPVGKYVHYSLFSTANTPLPENPKIDKLNTIVYGKGIPIPINLSAIDSKNWADIFQKKEAEIDMQKSNSFQKTQSNLFSTTGFKTTGLSRQSNTADKDLAGKNDRVLKKHREYERNYEKLLIKFDEESKRKVNRYQENQHEAPEFEKRMKEEEKCLNEMESVKINEDSRFNRRLAGFQKKKYDKVWKQFDMFFEKNLGKNNIDSKKISQIPQLKPSPSVSARDFRTTKDSFASSSKMSSPKKSHKLSEDSTTHRAANENSQL